MPFGVAKLRKDGIVHVVDDAQRVSREDYGRRELVPMIRFLRRVDSRQRKQRQAVLPEQGNEVRLECLGVQKMVVLAPGIWNTFNDETLYLGDIWGEKGMCIWGKVGRDIWAR